MLSFQPNPFLPYAQDLNLINFQLAQQEHQCLYLLYTLKSKNQCFEKSTVLLDQKLLRRNWHRANSLESKI